MTTAAQAAALALGDPGRPQSLAHGATGMTLPRIEAALAGNEPWDAVHQLLAIAAAAKVLAGPQASLYEGAPALGFALHAAAAARPGWYRGALGQVDAAVVGLTRRRLDEAHTRIDRQQRPALGEYDLFYGLTGLGVYALRHYPRRPELGAILSYLVRLTEPLIVDDLRLPGWWTHQAPTPDGGDRYAAGHGNIGMAHGITGPLALLALAHLQGHTVHGHADAIWRICRWLDRWRQDEHPESPWWPRTITLAEERSHRTRQDGPAQPSWCYGTPGVARAQQLAALATGEKTRRRIAETALLRCVSDLDQLAQIRDSGLCHGAAGLYQTVWRAAADAESPRLAAQLPHLAELLGSYQPGEDPGFLTGEAGRALAARTASTCRAPATGWDACLLLH